MKTILLIVTALTCLAPNTSKADVFDVGVIDNYSCHLISVITKWAKIRKQRNNNSKVIALAANGTAVTTKHELGRVWAKVTINNGKKGMVKWANLETRSTKCGIVNKRRKLNLHTEPLLKSRIIERIKPYSGLLILSSDARPSKYWLAVKTNKNRVGFVQKKFISID